MSQAYRGDNRRPPTRSKALWPEARHDDDMLVTHLDGEVVVYELSTHEVHTLNPTAAMVWQWCDGVTRPEELAQRLAIHLDVPLDQAKQVLWLTIDRLQRANLLTAPVVRPDEFAGVNRRRVMRMVGMTAVLLPVIHTIVAPSPAQAQSLSCTGCNCTTALGTCTPGSTVACIVAIGLFTPGFRCECRAIGSPDCEVPPGDCESC